MKEKCDIIAIFPIYVQLGAIRKPDSGRIICKTFTFINTNFLSYKNCKQNWKISSAALTLLLWVKVLFWSKKTLIFCTKCWHQQNLEGLGTKKFLKLKMGERVLNRGGGG